MHLWFVRRLSSLFNAPLNNHFSAMAERIHSFLDINYDHGDYDEWSAQGYKPAPEEFAPPFYPDPTL